MEDNKVTTPKVKEDFRVRRNISKFYVVCGVVISLCAIAEFIIWIVNANKVHMNNQLFMGTGFLAISVGVLWYLLFRQRSFKTANTGLWLTIIGGIVLFIIGISMSPSPADIAALAASAAAPV